MEDNKSTNDDSTNDDSRGKDVSLKGVVGIQNMGNTCYLNSIIQLLRVSPELNMYILTNDFSNINNKHRGIILGYQDINRALWSTYKSSYVRPLGFISEIRRAVKGTVYEMFGDPIPNDSHEFLIYLLDNFHEATKTPISDKISEKESGSKKEPYFEKIRSLAKKSWQEFLSKDNSPIVKLFFGMYKKTITCTNCNNQTFNWEVFNSLKIPCEGSTFIEWIKNECKDSEIEGYNCEKCNNKYTAKLNTQIWRLPKSLFITIRRFNYDGRKNISKCPYNGELLNFQEFFAEESDHKSKSWNYELRGVSDHHGSHLGGHYTTQFKHQISGEWWWMDDESSHKMETPLFSPSNYILLFRCINN